MKQCFEKLLAVSRVFPGNSASKESACNAGDLGSIPWLGRSPGEGNGYPLQYSCLENPHGQRSLAGGLQWGCKESDTLNHFHFAVSHILHNYYCERGRIFHPVNVLSYTSLFSLFLLLNMQVVLHFCYFRECYNEVSHTGVYYSLKLSPQFKLQ